ncbi:MAG: hypothetical protein ABI644_15060 [Arenimonas sp.]
MDASPVAYRDASTVSDMRGEISIQADRIFEGQKMVNFFSAFTKEPEDGAAIHRIPNTRQAGYIFPIQQIHRYQDVDQTIRLEGTIYIHGNASKIALPLLNKYFSNAGGKSRLGTLYVSKIHFQQAAKYSGNAVEISWLDQAELNKYTKENWSPENSGNGKMIVGLTQLGSDQVKINPVYADSRSMRTAFSGWPINPKQLRDTIKHTRGVFAHEMAHAMGLSHMRNSTGSIVSYKYGRSVNGEDARAICLLVTNNDEKLCPK